MLKKDLYLDHNIFLYLYELQKKDFEEYNKCIQILDKYRVYYTYGHLEELNHHYYNKELKNEKSEFKEKLNLIKDITKDNEIIFDKNYFVKKQEDIEECFKRIENYNNEQDFQDGCQKNVFINFEEIKIENVNDIKIKDFFFNEKIKKYFMDYLNYLLQEIRVVLNNPFLQNLIRDMFFLNRGLEIIDIKNDFLIKEDVAAKLLDILERKNLTEIKKYYKNFKFMEELMRVMFDFLYAIKFYKDTGKTAYRSRIYDTTHSIFATQTDIFMTADKRFFNKLELVYSFLDINTKLIFVEDGDKGLYKALNDNLNLDK